MTDDELLELVAKAQGWIDYPTDSIEMGRYWHLDADKAPFGPRKAKNGWNPLTDDAEAFRLAVAFGLDILHDTNSVTVSKYDNLNLRNLYKHIEWIGCESGAATRRAIVGVVAAIGRSME